ncbi:MAG: tol-pal system protein YbgF [Chitinispirillaceae bacterium]|nr:tol-pal system protein YbgF [Chitinispirillaceae bacterium]
MNNKIFILIVSSMLILSCAATRKHSNLETILPEIDVVSVKENSEEALKIAQETKLEIELLKKKIKETDKKISLLTEEMIGVSSAKIEEIENRLSLLVEAYKDLDAKITALQTQLQTTTQRKGGKAATFSPASATPLLGSPEYDLYQTALKVFNNKNYEKAIELFNEVIGQFPQGDYTGNSRYWIGECYFALGNYASAITSFNHVFDFKNHPKSDDAQFKIALSYLKMGEEKLAREEFKKLISRYPSSEYVDKAKNYLEGLK